MSKQQISSGQISKPSGHFSQTTMVETRGRLVFISGMTARRADGSIAGIGDIDAQTRQVCENLKAAVEAAGGTLEDILPRRRLRPQHGALRRDPQSPPRVFQGGPRQPPRWWRSAR